MPFERPTFHESWYRVEEMRPRLRSTVQISRQHFRGQNWHVVQDYTNNAFFRLSEPAYRFIGLLDGNRTVGTAWKIVNEQVGDDAPTQGEAIQLLGQLYTSNLIMGDIAPDTHGLFKRYKKRVTREIQGYLMNLMFVRIPILDPDRFIERWMPLLGWIFSPVGFIVWLLLFVAALHQISGVPNAVRELLNGSRNVMDPSNLIPLYLGFALIKACHEFGHAISCRKFGIRSGVGGEVHTMGIMFLVFSPIPYVDASSAWALKSKWQRIMVGFAGMWVELAIASIAAMVWAATGNNAWHQLAYNIMFVASFSTVIFNINPLLRYDGYYMLSDLLEIPNLAQRAKDYIYYLVRRYGWKVTQAFNPAHSTGEAVWLFFYAIASFIMRILVSVGIMLYLAASLQGALIFIAAAMAIAGLITWAVVPIGKFVHYLITSPELSRVRTRAILSSTVVVGGLVGAVTLPPSADRESAQGVVQPADGAIQDLVAGWDGFVVSTLAEARGQDFGSGPVTPGTMVLVAHNPTLEAEGREIAADLGRATIKRAMALQEDAAQWQAWNDVLTSLQDKARVNAQRQASLTLRAPIAGTLVAPTLAQLQGSYIHRGEKIGTVADLTPARLTVRTVVNNSLAGPLQKESFARVEIRMAGRPEIFMTGVFTPADISPAGQNQLPSAALGYQAGGQIAVSGQDPHGTRTTEQVFEVRIHDLQVPDGLTLLPGQRVVVRFDLAKKSLLRQGWTKLMRLVQKRLQS